MATVSLSPSLSSTNWTNQAKTDKKNADKAAPLAANLKQFESKHGAIKWDLLEFDKITSAADLAKRATDLDKAKQTALGDLKSQANLVAKAATDFIGKAGKEVDKKVGDLANKMKTEADAAVKAVEDKFSAAQKALELKQKTVAAAGKTASKTAAKSAAPAGAKNAKSMANTYKKLALTAVSNARFKPDLKPSRFMVVEFKKSLRLYIGMKYDKKKTEATWRALNPTDTFVKTHVDANSKVIWENNSLTLVSAKIQPKFATLLSKGSKTLFGKFYKIRMKKNDTEPAVESNNPEAKDVSEEELKAELAAMPADDEADDDEDVVEAGSDSDGEGEAPAVAAKSAGAAAPEPAAAKTTAAPAGQQAAAQQAAAQPAAKTAAAGAGGDLASLASSWTKTRDSALADIKSVGEAIVKLYPNGDKALRPAIEKLKDCQKELGAALDKALSAAATAKNDADRTKMKAAAKATVDKLLDYVNNNEVMSNLDGNDFKPVQAQAKLIQGLEQIKNALN